MEVDEMVGRLEQERKVGVQLEQAVLQAEEMLKDRAKRLKEFKVEQLHTQLQDQEKALARARTDLSQVSALNHHLRLQIDVYRKDRLDYNTLHRSRSLSRKQVGYTTHLLRGRSMRALGEVEALHSRLASLKSLHHEHSFSLQERAVGLEARIREDKRRNRAFIRSVEERKPEYTTTSACIKALLVKWTEKANTKRREIASHIALIASLASGFQVLNSSGNYDSPGSIAQATIAALTAEKNLLQTLLELKDEEQHVFSLYNSAAQRLERRRQTRELADQQAVEAAASLQTAVLDKEQEVQSVEVRVKLLRDSIEELGPVLREYYLTLTSFTPSLAQQDCEPETVLAALQPLEAGTTELATLLAVQSGRKRTPWPETRLSRVVVPVGLGAWESGEVGRPRTLQEFRVLASRAILNQSIPYTCV